VHVDADVLDDAVMPAVDCRQPGGLTPGELATILAAAMATVVLLASPRSGSTTGAEFVVDSGLIKAI